MWFSLMFLVWALYAELTHVVCIQLRWQKYDRPKLNKWFSVEDYTLVCKLQTIPLMSSTIHLSLLTCRNFCYNDMMLLSRKEGMSSQIWQRKSNNTFNIHWTESWLLQTKSVSPYFNFLYSFTLVWCTVSHGLDQITVFT